MMNTWQKSILLAATLLSIGSVWVTLPAADTAPSTLAARVEVGGSAQSGPIVPMSSLREDWSTVAIEPLPATF